MIDFYRELSRRVASGETMALATVIDVKGSTPREPGAKMAVAGDGKIIGTVGGGCGEAEVWRTSLEVIQTGQPRVVCIDLTEDIDSDRGAICGGTMEVFVEAVGPGRAE
jgi:xanthine dehydrogenase accessory factor